MFVSSDRFVDLSLRMLSSVVAVVLLACLGLLVYRWITPPAPVPPVTLVPVEVKAAATTPAASAPVRGEVLMVPGKVFSCVVNGRATFSDRPCGTASNSAPPAAH